MTPKLAALEISPRSQRIAIPVHALIRLSVDLILLFWSGSYEESPRTMDKRLNARATRKRGPFHSYFLMNHCGSLSEPSTTPQAGTSMLQRQMTHPI